MKTLNKLVAIALPALLLAGCELGSKEQEQVGFRGTAMVQISDPDSKAKVGDIPAPPYELTAEMIASQRLFDRHFLASQGVAVPWLRTLQPGPLPRLLDVLTPRSAFVSFQSTVPW